VVNPLAKHVPVVNIKLKVDITLAKHVPMVNTMIKLVKLPNPVVKTIVMLAPILILIKLRV